MARTAMVAGVEVHLDHWIDGRRVPSVSTFDDHSPIDQSVIARVAAGGGDEARVAVTAARRAFGGWSRTSPATRAAMLHRIADGIEARLEDLSQVETADSGALLRDSRRAAVPRSALNFRFFADRLLELRHDDLDTHGHTSRISWDPAGVALLITPWNAPLRLETWKIAPALAAGNTVVLKPAEWAPLSASLLADIIHEAGLPAGVFNVVHGIGEAVGPPLVTDPGVARISFTGSVETARTIAAQAASNLTPLSLELGGKSPFLVFADADLEAAVSQAIAQYHHAGQICLAGTRLLVERGVHDAFLDRFLARARNLVMGDPRDDATDVGPLITQEHLARVDGFVQRARADGARAVIGGGPHPELGGLFYSPTLFVDVRSGSEILAREVFGPVLTLQPFDDEDEAIRMANDSEYGLAAAVYTGDRARADRVARQLVAGTVWVNCFFVRDVRAPFGGCRHSGIGREGGTWSFDFFCDLKTTVVGPAHGRTA